MSSLQGRSTTYPVFILTFVEIAVVSRILTSSEVEPGYSTPAFSPIMYESSEVKGFIFDCGWGSYGFKTGLAAGYNVAELVRTNEAPDMIRPFTITRFYENRPADERTSA